MLDDVCWNFFYFLRFFVSVFVLNLEPVESETAHIKKNVRHIYLVGRLYDDESWLVC